MTTVNVKTQRDLRIIRLHVNYIHREGAAARTVYHRERNLLRLAAVLACTLLDATAEELDAWHAAVSRSCSVSTLATYTAHVRMFYRWLVDAGHRDDDPTVRLPRTKVPRGKPRPISEQDLQRVLDVAPEPVRTWVLLGAFMGLRVHEIAQIRREDITEHDGRLTLSGIGKGQKPFVLDVPVGIERALRSYLTARPGPIFWMRPYPAARFPSRPARAHDVTLAIAATMRGLGIPHTAHSLRHRFGTAFYRETHDLLLTQDVMRHDDPKNTRLYVETSNLAATAAMDRLSTSASPRSSSRRRRPTTGEAA